MIETKKIKVNDTYYIKIAIKGNARLYSLKETYNDITIVESFNRDSFLLKASKITRITSNIENLVASY